MVSLIFKTLFCEPNEIIKRAESRLQEKQYSLRFNNCGSPGHTMLKNSFKSVKAR